MKKHLNNTPANSYSIMTVIMRGLKSRCPQCGTGRLYRTFLKPVDRCEHCNEELGHIRSDDIPAYFTVLVVGHLVVPAAVFLEQYYHPSTLFHLLIWIPLSLILTFLLMPNIKGASIGLLWRLKPINSR